MSPEGPPTVEPVETQHSRTQLAWTRTGLSLAGAGLVEARLLAASAPGRAPTALGAALGLVVILGVTAAIRLRLDRDALTDGRRRTGGFAPALVAAIAVLLGLGAVRVVLPG